jgi:hypothetical protein
MPTLAVGSVEAAKLCSPGEVGLNVPVVDEGLFSPDYFIS